VTSNDWPAGDSDLLILKLICGDCSGGVHPGDVITSIDGDAVTSSADVYKAVNTGKSLKLTILRTDSLAPMTLNVTPESVQ